VLMLKKIMLRNDLKSESTNVDNFDIP
jgi:hypothetical protein